MNGTQSLPTAKNADDQVIQRRVHVCDSTTHWLSALVMGCKVGKMDTHDLAVGVMASLCGYITRIHESSDVDEPETKAIDVLQGTLDSIKGSPPEMVEVESE